MLLLVFFGENSGFPLISGGKIENKIGKLWRNISVVSSGRLSVLPQEHQHILSVSPKIKWRIEKHSQTNSSSSISSSALSLDTFVITKPIFSFRNSKNCSLVFVSFHHDLVVDVPLVLPTLTIFFLFLHNIYCAHFSQGCRI